MNSPNDFYSSWNTIEKRPLKPAWYHGFGVTGIALLATIIVSSIVGLIIGFSSINLETFLPDPAGDPLNLDDYQSLNDDLTKQVEQIISEPGIFWTTIALGQIVLILAAWLYPKIMRNPIRIMWRLNPYKGKNRNDFLIGIAGMAIGSIGVWLVASVFESWIFKSNVFSTEDVDALSGVIINSTNEMFLVPLLVIAVMPALCEEFLFRGVVLSHFQINMHPITAAVICGLLFALFHLAPAQIIPIIPIGIWLSYIAIRSGSIIPGIALHFLNNLIAILLIKYGSSESWLASGEWLWLLIGIILSVAGIFLFENTSLPSYQKLKDLYLRSISKPYYQNMQPTITIPKPPTSNNYPNSNTNQNNNQSKDENINF
jgi:membrane protease YdiL (CAAX protease family)